MKLLAELFHKLLRLPPRERWLLARAWLLLLVMDLALRFVPFPTILTYCQRVPEKSHNEGKADTTLPVNRDAWLVEAAGRYCPIRTSCLKEALVLSWLMGRRGVATTLRIGVARREGVLTAHAWLEQDGRIIHGNRDRDAYAPLLPLHQ